MPKVLEVAEQRQAETFQYPAIKSEEELEAEQNDTSEYLVIKPEKLEAIRASMTQVPKKQRPAFKHTCSRCGKTFELAIQLDPTRPMYCTECRPLVAEERKKKQSGMRAIRKAPVPNETASEVGDPPESSLSHSAAQAPNRPRLIRDLPPLPPSEEEDDGDLLASILKSKDKPVDLRKQSLEKQAGPVDQAKRKRRRHKPDARPENKPSSAPTSLPPGQRIQF